MIQRHKMSILFLLCLISGQVWSQSIEEKDSVEVFPAKTWLIGLNTQLFFDFVTEDLFGGDSLISPRIELLARRNYTSNKAIRLRVFGEFQSFTQESAEPTPNPPFIKNRYSAIGMALGHEWQFFLSKKWFGYYGVEFEFEFSSSKREKDEAYLLSEDNQPQNRYDVQTKKGYALAGMPFIGFGYRVTERMVLSAEAKIIGSHFWASTAFKESIRLDDPQMTIPIPTPVTYQDDLISKETNFYIRPYTGIFVNYLF